MIPLSDSPPPSRWKPGQKPWKPSYIHIQEIKAKVAANISSTGQAADGVTKKSQTPVTATIAPVDSESNKTHKPVRQSHSRSSRSKSYSRSCSGSRSRSYSRSRTRSRSPHRYRSRSSSYSQSDSESSQKKRNKTDSPEKNWKEYYSSLKRTKHLDKYVSLTGSQDTPSGSENRVGSEHSPVISVPRRSSSSEKIKERGSSQEQEIKHCSSVTAETFKCRSEWDSDSDKVSQSNSTTKSKKQQQEVQSGDVLDKKVPTLTGWNSESDSENVTARALAISEKEEGEASSESEYESYRKTSEVVASQEKMAAIASNQSEGSPEKAPAPEKHKSKKKAKRKHKHKRRSENKSSSHHSKCKGKRCKRKHQKPKETFHWQPPLEFGDDEEEDESKREKHSPVKALRDRTAVDSVKAKDQHLSSLNKNPPREEDRGQERTKHSEPHLHSSSRNGVNVTSVKEQDSLDDMDICTPEHDAENVALPVEQDSHSNAPEVTLKPTSDSSDVASRDGKEQSSASSTTTGGQQDEATSDKPAGTVINFKWRPLKGTSALQNVNVPPITSKHLQFQENQNSTTQGVRLEIKSKSRVRPGSLFDEVRKTARLNQRPRNQESSSEERSPSAGKTGGVSRARSPKKSGSMSRKSHSASSHRSRSRDWSRSYSRSRSRSRSSSYSSR